MNEPLTGRYCDGRSLRSVPVSIELTPDELRFHGAGLDGSAPLREIKSTSRLGRVPRFLRTPDGAMLEVPDSEEMDAALEGARPEKRSFSPIHWLESKAAIAAVSTVLIAAGAASTIEIGLPMLARHAAQLVPQEVETKIGQTSTAIFIRGTSPSTLIDDYLKK